MKHMMSYIGRCVILVSAILCAHSMNAQQIKDAFILIDCSATMNQSNINFEARQIISELLVGNYSYEQWCKRGWLSVSAAGNYFTTKNTQMVRAGGKVCLIPFGNMDRVRDYVIESYVNNNSVSEFVESHFPTKFTDRETFLNLAHAYVFDVAVKNGISGIPVYMILYSDGMGDNMKRKNYPNDLKNILDTYGTDSMSTNRHKLGILRKTADKDFDIEIWRLGIPIPPVVQPPEDSTKIKNSTVVEPPRYKNITITNPKGGASKSNPEKWKKDESHKVVWTNQNGSIKVNVLRKNGNDFKKISGKDKGEVYKLSVSGTMATVTFFENGDYKVIVADSKGNDYRYISVNEFPVMTIVIIIIVVAVGVMLPNYIRKQKHGPDTHTEVN